MHTRIVSYVTLCLILGVIPAAVIAVVLDSLAMPYFLPRGLLHDPQEFHQLIQNARWYVTPVGNIVFFGLWLGPAIGMALSLHRRFRAEQRQLFMQRV